MYTQNDTSVTTSAPAVARDTADREHVKTLATAAALPMPGDCEHCHGTGRDRDTAQQIVHAFGPYWFGQNWDLDRLHAAIDSADHIRWVNDPADYDLVVLIDGEQYRFQVKRPAAEENAA